MDGELEANKRRTDADIGAKAMIAQGTKINQPGDEAQRENKFDGDLFRLEVPEQPEKDIDGYELEDNTALAAALQGIVAQKIFAWPLLHGDKEAGRFSSLLTWCRMVLRYDLKHHWGLLPPDAQYNCKLGKFCSGQFPPGTLFKAQVFLTEEEMKLFAMNILSLDDRWRHARCWHFPLSTC